MGPELWDLDTLTRVLKDRSVCHRLYRCFQSAVESDVPLAAILAENYNSLSNKYDGLSDNRTTSVYTRDSIIDVGHRLGSFLNEVGWFSHAQDVLIACRNLCQSAPRTTHYVRMTLECCHRLLHAQASYCSFGEASENLALSISLLDETYREESFEASSAPVHAQTLPSIESCAGGTRAYCRAADAAPPPPEPSSPALRNLTLRLYSEFALLHFLRSDYRQAYWWGSRALGLLRPDTPVEITVDVLSACAKACVVMQEFKRAGTLMQQAVALARQWLGSTTDPRYSIALLDYGFYLLNADSSRESVPVYEEALAGLKAMFREKNLLLAVAHVDLSYALYVYEYTSGMFSEALEHADIALKIMEGMLPPTNLLLAYAKRVKALIQEEIALDFPSCDSKAVNLLAESETLQQASLELSLMELGEMNLQTSKLYGNLGRLYQSMRRFKEAEEMQLKAISIKEKLFGTEDHEVGLSLGHLASLYCYQMNMYVEAEKAYSRSIAISLKLFGERYSGLQYDYLGMVHVNNELKKPDRAAFYNEELAKWKTLQDQPLEPQQPAFGLEEAIPIPQLKLDFFRQDDEE